MKNAMEAAGEWFDMKEKYRQGVSISQISKEYGRDRKTVRKYVQSQIPPEGYARRNQGPSILDPFKVFIKERLDLYPALTAVKLFEEIQARGYAGKYTIVKEFIRPLKNDMAIAAELRYETKPGEQAQVDWFDFGPIIIDGIRVKLWCFSMILGYSRMRYVEFVTDCTTATFIRCHINAFIFFGGYTQTILYDNTKNVVLKRMLISSDSVWNPLFKDFFTYYGFTVRLCKPGVAGAKTKGKIENTGRFIRSNLFLGLEFTSIPDLNSKSIEWCHKVNSKVHGTTHEIPLDRWNDEHLLPIINKPPYQIILTEYRRVSRDCFISYRSNKYSIPWKYAGREAKLEIHEDLMRVNIGGSIVCEHEIVPGSHRLIKVKDHFAGLYKEILNRNKAAHIRRIESHGSKQSPVLVLNGPSTIDVQKRDLAVYDDIASRGKSE